MKTGRGGNFEDLESFERHRGSSCSKLTGSDKKRWRIEDGIPELMMLEQCQGPSHGH